MAVASKYFPKTLNAPPKGRVWLHIDHFDKSTGNVWALQFWEGDKLRYRVAKSVVIAVTPAGAGVTRTLKKGSPKAVIEFLNVTVRKDGPYEYYIT